MTDSLNKVVKGVYYCNQERANELNERLYKRNIPSSVLQPSFSLRPASTKYDHMSIFDKRTGNQSTSVQIKRQPTFNVNTTFNPGNSTAPWSGYATNVNDESKLRNQFFALQKCEQSNWVPSTNSDLYNVVVVGRKENQAFPYLFAQDTYNQFNPNTQNLGNDLWNNHTRQQLKNNENCNNC